MAGDRFSRLIIGDKFLWLCLGVESGIRGSLPNWGMILRLREKGSHIVLGVELGIRVSLLDWGLILELCEKGSHAFWG